MYYTVYKIRNKSDNKIYIGYHKTDDINDGYMGSGLYISRAIKKYGIENFEKEILKICETEEEMILLEKSIVDDCFINREDTYNLKIGGTGGFRKGMVNVPGKQVTKIEFDNDNSLSGIAKNKIAVFDKDGKCFQTHKNDIRIKNGELIRAFFKNGIINCIDKETDKKVRISKEIFDNNRDRYISIFSGKAKVKDKEGNSFLVSVNDERYLSGELVGHTKGISNLHDEYTIFDNSGNVIYTITGQSFRSFCKENNLPSVLDKSHLNGGIPIYSNLGSNEKRLEEKGMLKYKGWYSKCIKKRNYEKFK